MLNTQFLPSGQYGLWFGYCFSGPLPLRSHKEQVTFSGPFRGVPSHLDYTRNDTGPNSTVGVKIDIFVMAIRVTLKKLQLI